MQGHLGFRLADFRHGGRDEECYDGARREARYGELRARDDTHGATSFAGSPASRAFIDAYMLGAPSVLLTSNRPQSFLWSGARARKRAKSRREFWARPAHAWTNAGCAGPGAKVKPNMASNWLKFRRPVRLQVLWSLALDFPQAHSLSILHPCGREVWEPDGWPAFLPWRRAVLMNIRHEQCPRTLLDCRSGEGGGH